MDETIVKKIKTEADKGIEAGNMRQTDRASLHFNNALNLAEDLEDERTRRDEISLLATLFEMYDFPDLALPAAEEAVELDHSLGLDSLLGQDLLTVGNAHSMMENTVKAEALFQEALEIFLKRDEWANAASASTNIAGIVANGGDIPRAIEILKTSLEYLVREPFDDTEINTRLTLLQAMELEGHDIEHTIENARLLCSRFWDKMTDMHRNVAREFVARAVERHPSSNSAAWKVETFPMLYR